MSHTSAGVGRMTDMELVEGKGSWVTSSNGNKYLDFTCGIGVTNLGHCHPHVVAAIQDQASKIIHAQANIAWHKPMLDLIEVFSQVAPKPLDSFFFWNSGAEAVEASLKLARHATKKPNIIVFNGSFHGRTIGTMSLTTSKTIYRAGFGPLMPGVFVAPFPYAYRSKCRHASLGGPALSDEVWEQRSSELALDDLDIMLKTQTSPSETAAMLIEPVLGEGGYVPAPPYFLQRLREICTKNGILLMVDEVQSGFGRTGKWFAIEHSNVTPDVIVFAKGVASGLPLSGIISTQELMSKQPAGSMGGTYGGNAVACRAAQATIEVFQKENILKNVEERGKQLRDGLKALQAKYPQIGDVRGIGLMIGLEFAPEKDKPKASEISKICRENGLLLLTCSVFDTIRFIPPLNASQQEIQQALNIFEKALKQYFKQ
uniref:4-aminobutyrate aminotransferase n=1 Tax=Arcella intermedia TaxID=1963864 RepID=A0A6B2L4T5_9EUKA